MCHIVCQRGRTILQALSDLIDAMIMHIHHLVHDKQRPFSYLDFIRFEVDGHDYRMAHGTFRNNVSVLMKEGLVEVSYKSNIAFYTLRGVKFGKTSRIVMTRDHTGVHSSSVLVPWSTSSLTSHPLYRLIRDLPLDKCSIHDLHLRFESRQIYELTSLSISNGTLGYDYAVNTKSKDILLKFWEINGLLIKVTIHRTDTVSVVIGCSINPIAMDISGVIQLTNVLSIVGDRLSRLVEASVSVPPHSAWVVTMWHFGADASVEYSGEKFNVTLETAENILIRAYSKVMDDGKTGIRLERQEYPRTTLADAIEQKINSNQRSGGWSDGAG